MKNVLKKLKNTGFFAIYLSTILTKVIVLFGGILIVRLLSIEDYSIYVLVNNAFSMLNILGDFGVSSAILLYLVDQKDNEEKKNAYLKYGIKYGIITSFITTVLFLLSPFFYPYREKIITNYTLILCLIPLLNVGLNIISSVLRANEDNKKYSILQVITIFIHYITIIIFCILFGLTGSIYSQYIYSVLSLIIAIFIAKKYLFKKTKKKSLLKDEKIKFIRYSLSTQFANLTSSLLYSIDIFVIGLLVLNDKDLSLYKVSTIIPNALSFLPACLMVYLVPYFIKHSKDSQWIKKSLKKLIGYGFIIYLIIALVLIFSSKYIFLILYGKKYVNSMYPFIILMIGFIFSSTIKTPIGNILAALKHPVYNTIINVICLVADLFFNYICIKIWGYIGAAIATTIIIIISSGLYMIIIRKVLSKNEES